MDDADEREKLNRENQFKTRCAIAVLGLTLAAAIGLALFGAL
jgi:hypothetical protein